MKTIFHKNFYVIVVFVFVLRLLLAFFPSFTIDMNNWVAWSGMLGRAGPLKFYSLPGWTDYTPGFLYHLWLLGVIDKSLHFGASLYPFLVKLPVIVADIGIGLLLYKILLKKNFKLAVFAFLAYTVNPVVMFTNSIWGQTDGLIAFFLLLSAYLLAGKRDILLSSLFWVLALFVKPQALVALPILFIYLLLGKKPKKAIFFILFSLVFIFLIGLPFFASSDPILGLPKLIAIMSNESPFTSVMAFNFWALVKGMWIPDSGTFLGIKYVYWGAAFLTGALGLVLARTIKFGKTPQNLYISLGLAYLVFFLFPTRVHERYILVSLPFFLLSAGLMYSKIEFVLFFFLSGLALINIYHPYAYYTPDSFLSSIKILEVTTSSYKFISLLYVLLFFAYLFKDKIQKSFKLNINFSKMFVRKKGKESSFPVCNLTQRYIKYSLIAILLFSFLTRVGWLGSPKSEYFDEVYHAFTARLILHNDPKAWEWWNPHPEGFAYEWTHPPLAKLGMVLGMKMFGENSFGWRFPGAFLGVGSVLLVFLLASEIFKDKLTGVLSSAVFALDGLPVVMSRIGMNDSYILFFSLLSVYLFIKKQDYLSAFSFGLALSSKWSAIWAIPVLFVLWLSRKKKISVGLLWFLLLPPIIYLACYAPMFWTGHNLDIFWEMQKQMWWYHTGLKATHPYTSSWWSWPLLVRPIYLYTSNEINDFVSRIYAMGNPVVFWFGLASVIASFVYAFIGRNKKLAFVVFSYLIFFVPWAASPRIMFLYHYLPSVPFLAIATGFILRKNPYLITPVLITMFVAFLYFYPHYAGLKIPLDLDTSYYWFSSWR